MLTFVAFDIVCNQPPVGTDVGKIHSQPLKTVRVWIARKYSRCWIATQIAHFPPVPKQFCWSVLTLNLFHLNHWWELSLPLASNGLTINLRRATACADASFIDGWRSCCNLSCSAASSSRRRNFYLGPPASAFYAFPMSARPVPLGRFSGPLSVCLFPGLSTGQCDGFARWLPEALAWYSGDEFWLRKSVECWGTWALRFQTYTHERNTSYSKSVWTSE